ncbi:Splicing factor ESS-2 [Trichostrongylus colubriformis]|uniref:Splicing factor ESS-2 n=1 Tax=Trichostrongylus colubriformis TaxID=6319 RepID=A0AAN8FSB2_TRICO
MSAKKCAREECGKTVYPIEELKCLDKVWHKQCFKCTVCGMTLSMKNYKGYDKKPYCEPHYPKTVASVVMDTPEMRRVAENTKNQSQVQYHAAYEKTKGTKIEVADDPEMERHRKNMQAQSQVAYTGELDKRKKMEEVRPTYVPAEASAQQPQERVVGSIADYDPLNGSWGTAAQPKTSEASSSETRYCLDFTESGRNSAYGAAKPLSPSGPAGFAVKAIYDYTAADKDEVVKLSPKRLQTKREVRTVLPEEQYLAKLEKIIVRDYFPDLPKLKAQTEYMDAVKRNDIAKMRELQLRYHTSRRTDRRTSPANTAATSPGHQARAPTSPVNFDPDTPGPSRPPDSLQATPLPYANREGDNEALKEDAKKGKAKPEELSVDAYMNKFTSEDNASFEELAAVELAKERAKKGWIEEAERKHNAKMVTYGELPASADLQLAIKYDPEFDRAKPKEVDNWSYTARNSVLFHLEGAPLTAAERIEQARRNQRVINKTGTRFSEDIKNKPSEASMARASMMQLANNAGKVDAQGHEVGLNSKTLGLVATPSPAPGIDDSPLMTWGEIDGTPFRLDASDIQPAPGSGPSFKMPEVPFREQVAQGITDTIAKRYRDKRRAAMETAEKAHRTPRFGSARSSALSMATLSPAARRLASNKLGIRLPSSAHHLRVLTPTRVGSTRLTPGLRSGSNTPSGKETPKLVATKKPAVASSITDNLMPVSTDESAASNRPTAGDFF